MIGTLLPTLFLHKIFCSCTGVKKEKQDSDINFITTHSMDMTMATMHNANMERYTNPGVLLWISQVICEQEMVKVFTCNPL